MTSRSPKVLAASRYSFVQFFGSSIVWPRATITSLSAAGSGILNVMPPFVTDAGQSSAGREQPPPCRITFLMFSFGVNPLALHSISIFLKLSRGFFSAFSSCILNVFTSNGFKENVSVLAANRAFPISFSLASVSTAFSIFL